MPYGSWMTVTNRETHLEALRARGCHSELFTAVTREEAERIASAELAEIAAQTERGVELARSSERFAPSLNHTGGRQKRKKDRYTVPLREGTDKVSETESAWN